MNAQVWGGGVAWGWRWGGGGGVNINISHLYERSLPGGAVGHQSSFQPASATPIVRAQMDSGLGHTATCTGGNQCIWNLHNVRCIFVYIATECYHAKQFTPHPPPPAPRVAALSPMRPCTPTSAAVRALLEACRTGHASVQDHASVPHATSCTRRNLDTRSAHRN